MDSQLQKKMRAETLNILKIRRDAVLRAMSGQEEAHKAKMADYFETNYQIKGAK